MKNTFTKEELIEDNKISFKKALETGSICATQTANYISQNYKNITYRKRILGTFVDLAGVQIDGIPNIGFYEV